MTPRSPLRITTVAPLRLAAVLGALLLLGLVATPTASASGTQRMMLQDDVHFLRSPDRDRYLDEAAALGVDMIKVAFVWAEYAPDAASATKPAGFDGADPAEYGGRWADHDAFVQAARARGIDVLAMVVGPAPRWAVASDRGGGVDRPDPAEFGRFQRAIGTRYSGSYAGLPRIDKYSIWTEPNLYKFLLPQFRNGVPYSPRLYRALFNAAVEALNATGHGGDTILYGELLPQGDRSRRSTARMRPLEFLRELGCVNRRFRRYRGRAARAHGCSDFSPIPGTGLSYHAYSPAGGPTVRPRHRDDAFIGQLSRITRTLDRLGSRGRLVDPRPPVWSTEFGYQSNPPDRYQTPISRVPAFINEGEWRAWRSGRVAAHSQYILIDDPILGGRAAGYQSGLRFADGSEKPGVYDAFRSPLFVRLRSRGSVEVWGAARPLNGGGGTVTVQQRLGSGGFEDLGTVPVGPGGYFDQIFSISRAASRTFRFVYADRDGTPRTSRNAKAARR